MSVFNKINDNLIVDTFKNVFQRRSSEVFQPDIPECRTIQKYMLQSTMRCSGFERKQHIGHLEHPLAVTND